MFKSPSGREKMTGTNAFKFGLAIACLLFSTLVKADVYQVTGGNFTSLNGTAYTTSMKVTGEITTSGPIPANSVNYDISPLVTAFSFTDGVQTVDNLNGVFYDSSTGNARPQFNTDDTGNITTARFNVSTIYPAVLNGPFSAIAIDDEKTAGYLDGACQGVTNGFCTTPAEAEGFSSGESEEGASWIHEVAPPPPEQAATPIPTLSRMTIILFAMLLGLTVLVRRKHLF